MLNISPNNRNGIDEQQFVSYQILGFFGME
jgi:hypothetical protein